MGVFFWASGRKQACRSTQKILNKLKLKIPLTAQSKLNPFVLSHDSPIFRQCCHRQSSRLQLMNDLATITALLLLAGLLEIGGGWLVWQTIRESQPAYFAILGSVVLVAYGFVPTLQPLDDFGRIYAAYGGAFTVLSLLWGGVVDKLNVDRGDVVGSVVVLVGVMVILAYPREER